MCKMNWAQGELKVAGKEKETRRKEQRKNGLGQITKPFTPTQAIYVHIDEVLSKRAADIFEIY